MAIDLHTRADFISAVKYAPKPIAFLVGAPISADLGGGVPGVSAIITLVRDEIRLRGPSEIPRFDAELIGKSEAIAYQIAMRWLQGNFTQDAVNRVVEKAVLIARLDGTPTDFLDIGEINDWYLPAGLRQLARLVARQQERFPGPIITTNFDPLISVAIEVAGGRASWHILDADGHFGRTAGMRQGETQVIHLHGYWRGADTLHTPGQLTADRPKLDASLHYLLRQRTLVVVAYGGWDDSFTRALAGLLVNGHPDDRIGVNVLWCFYENDPNLIESKYRSIFNKMPPGHFVAYGGIDCHSIFEEFGGLSGLSNYPSILSCPTPPSPIAGWEEISPDFLAALPCLTENELIKYFDGAVPTLRHAKSPSIPKRQALDQIRERLKTFEPGDFGCSMQLIRAAGGEGKSTLLLQAAVDAAESKEWTVLWRSTPDAGLPAEHVLTLDRGKRWLIVADEAETLVSDLEDSARMLYEAGRSNIHFLIAARDTDWWTKFGDRRPWEQWLTAWVRRKDAITLRGITRDDATKIVNAWKMCGTAALRSLSKVPEGEHVNTLIHAVRDAAPNPGELLSRAYTFEGSFFGGLLDVRFGQNGLQAHVRFFLDRLRQIRIQGSERTLFDALVYIAACHAIGIAGINEHTLANLVDVPEQWVRSLVILPLGEEAAAVQAAGRVLTRHQKVALAILVEVDQLLDLAEVWKQLVCETVKTKQWMPLGEEYAMILHAGPRIWKRLPYHFSTQRRSEIAIAAASAALEYNPRWLGCVVSLGRTYREVGNLAEASKLFRDALGKATEKVDYLEHIRGYWHEWGVSEGLLGKQTLNPAADAWIDGLSLADHLNPAPITEENIKQTCVSLGIAFGALAQQTTECPFARGRRAAVFIGRSVENDPKSTQHFDRIARDADLIGTPEPQDSAEAHNWLHMAVASAGRELRDPYLVDISTPESISFMSLESFLKGNQQTMVGKSWSIQGASLATIEIASLTSQSEQEGALHSPRFVTNEKQAVRSQIFEKITSLVERSLLDDRLLQLPQVGDALERMFSGDIPVHTMLGYRTLTDLILSFEEFVITGAHPRWLVRFREDWQTNPERDLRYESWLFIKNALERCDFEGRPLYLAAVGQQLAARFRMPRPVHVRLGFSSFRDLIESYDDLIVSGEAPRLTVEYATYRKGVLSADLRSEIAGVIEDLLMRHASENKPLLLVFLGVRLSEIFPEAKPIHRSLGFQTLTDLVWSFDQFKVTGNHPKLVVEHREEAFSLEREDLRSEVEVVIGELLSQFISEERPLYLPILGFTLADQFPNYKPVYRKLGFDSLTDLVVSYERFAIYGEHPRWTVGYSVG